LLGPLLAGLAVDLTASYRGGIIFALATGLLGFIAIASLRRNGQPERGSAADAT
jgi:MFS-type transporter involved in bile tolerance (Atg22 family)